MHKKVLLVFVMIVFFVLIISKVVLSREDDKNQKKEQIQHGQVLVFNGGCNDCHSPKIHAPDGLQPDYSRLLSGHPQDVELPEVPPGLLGPEKWLGMYTKDQTAWAGPWGVSFAANLTPDKRTGIGNWTEDMFIRTMRSKKHKGFGREVLPPMPWEDYNQLSDEELKAIFAYLRTLKPVENSVPDPIPLPEEMQPSNR
jgi:mono/diheme cytochrome c family protein